jgi:hypothetical protein
MMSHFTAIYGHFGSNEYFMTFFAGFNCQSTLY